MKDSTNEKSAIIDDNNIIKKAELLYSLSFIRRGTADCDDLIKKIAKELKGNQINSESWTFFINSENKDDADIIPTAMSVLALHANNCDGYKAGRIFLSNEVNKIIIKDKIKDPETFSKIVLALYVLVFTANGELETKEREYRTILKKIWSSNFAFMKSDIEQNIEYPYNTRHFYVRIPWQLYLLAISNKLSYRYSAKVYYFSRLNSILEQTNEDGFKYLHSGKHISSRTNAILFDIIEQIKRDRKNILAIFILNFFDKMLNFLRKKYVKYFFNFIGLAIIIGSFCLWRGEGRDLLTDLTPAFVASFAVYLLVFNIKPSNN